MEERDEELEIDLEVLMWNFFRELKKYWWLLLLLILAGGVFGIVRSSVFYRPMYKSSASFTVMTGDGSASDSGYNFYYDKATAGQMAKTFPYILSSNLLQEAIKADLNVGSINGTIKAEAVSESNLITMTVTSASAEDAKVILESAVRVYPEVARFVIGDIRFNMIDNPAQPAEPYNKPDYKRVFLKWSFVGAAAAVLMIGILALMRKTVQDSKDLSAVMNLECLSSLPKVRFKARSRENHQQISVLNGRISQGFKESVLSLALRLQREMDNKNAKVIVVTSSVPGEGKSTAALNLAYAQASYGKKVLFIDGDLRKQSDRKEIISKPGYGLEDIIMKKCQLTEAVEKDKKSGIWVLCGSKSSKNIPKLLNSAALKSVLKALKECMDMVIIDAPPCLLFEDAGILAENADCILYVVRHDFIHRRKILEGVSLLEDTGRPILGYIFNEVPEKRSGYGYYHYGRSGYYDYRRYGYGEKNSLGNEENSKSRQR